MVIHCIYQDLPDSFTYNGFILLEGFKKRLSYPKNIKNNVLFFFPDAVVLNQT